jgi:hypothetical protein
MRLTPEQARVEWAKALRSGEYQQTVGYLSKETPDGCKYCCLGVACDLFRRFEGEDLLTVVTREELEWNSENDNWTPTDNLIRKYGELGIDTALPDRVADWLGIKHGDGEFYPTELPEFEDEDSTSLAELNDTHSWTFNQIADLIESNPEGLWTEK